jgi:N-acetylglutamate synthase-like GNAT family acetyltransferase
MKIVPFKRSHQPLVDRMLEDIQQEFVEPFTSRASRKMEDANKVIGTKFWVLMDGNMLAGTVGLIRMKNSCAALKSLFIPLKYRGTIAAALLVDTVIGYSKKNRISTIYLGTMQQMKAAQKFYLKSGFVEINENDLPKDFPANVLDTVFFMRKL